METLLDIASENESEKWELVKGKYDYTGFFKDKKLDELFMLFPMGQLSNRILVGNLKKRTKWKKELEGGQDMNSSNVHGGGQIPTSPTTPGAGLQKSRMKFFDQMNTLKSKSYLGFLLSQRPLNEINEETYLKDNKTISKPKCLEAYNFNTVYLFDYSGPGDTRPHHKMIAIK